MTGLVKKIAVVAAAAVALGAWTGTAQAWPWSWDMFQQSESHKPQKEPAPPMPAGTVPASGKPTPFKDRGAAATLKNPTPATPESIERGRLKYETYCSTCHGAAGKGDGLVGQKYVAPTDLTGDYVQKKTDGDLYYTITYGGLAIMPSYGDSVAYDDRWHIINYIKTGFAPKAEAATK